MIYRINIAKEIQTGKTVIRPTRQTIRYSAFLTESFPYLEQVKWASSQWNERPWDWSAFQDRHPLDEFSSTFVTFFLFNNADDAMLFKLTWGGELEEISAYSSIRSMVGSV